MKQKILKTITALAVALVCSLPFSLTGFAEDYPVINMEDVVTEMSEIPDSGRDENGVRYICDRFGNLTDVPFDMVYENQRYELCFYQNGIGYTGIAIVDGEEWKFENGTALNGEYEENGRCVAYIDGKTVNGPYTYMDGEFFVPRHVESYTDKYGDVVEAAVNYNCWRYAENGTCRYSLKDGWYGPEEYRRFYDGGILLCGMADSSELEGTQEYGKYFNKGVLFTGFYAFDDLMYDPIKLIACYIDGERYFGHYQVKGNEEWSSESYKDSMEYWKSHLEAGKTYLFSEEETNTGYVGILQEGFYEENGCRYWYEGGIRQGTEGRGKEIYDPETDAWYWLDAVDNGKVATGKDVYQESYAGAYADRPDGTGKWVRYDENGHMIKGWCDTEAGTYYFDLETGAMAKGTAVIDGKEYTFDKDTGILTSGVQHDRVWVSVGGKDYWYENGVRQGYDPDNPDYRGKEIYDPASDAWYWLDNIQQGAKAVSKDVYQESWAGCFGDNGEYGKWVRYDENGHMVKGWQSVLVEDEIKGHYKYEDYYFDLETGAMVKGKVSIIEVFEYEGNASVYECISLFDEIDGHRVEVISYEPYTGDREVGSAIRLE